VSSLAHCRLEFEEIALRAGKMRPLSGTEAELMGRRLAGMVLDGRAARGR
jgi:hypothetical protein